MPKAKLSFLAQEKRRWYVAASLSAVKMNTDGMEFRGEHIVTCSYRDPQGLIKMGRLIETLTAGELDGTAATAKKRSLVK